MFTGFSLWLLQLDCDLLRSLAPFGSPSQPSRYSASWSLSVEPVLVQFKFCSHTERKEDHRNDLLPFGSSNWTRTSDTLINSQVLLPTELRRNIETQQVFDLLCLFRCRRLSIFPDSCPSSIVDASELNYCVRNGNRWTLTAIGTDCMRENSQN